CAPAHIIVARGSNEPQGPGVIGSLANMTMRDAPGTSMESIVWPATIDNYANSSSEGTAATTAALSAKVLQCPQTKIIMMGYSQGAHVIGDSLCGGGLVGLPTPPVDPAISANVVAIVQYGDPRHLPNMPYDIGTSIKTGLFPRNLATQSCSRFAPLLRSFCDTGDPFCDQGTAIEVHRRYAREYNAQAREFVAAMLG
ncbi:carbohydrate esterase family 5 protein, partial [Aulographum hederae CBS 113979]